MATSRRLLQAAAALSACLSERSIPHAFHGTITTTVLGAAVDAQVPNHIILSESCLTYNAGYLLHRGGSA